MALFVLNCRLREFPLSTIANRFEFTCQATDGIVFGNPSLLIPVHRYEEEPGGAKDNDNPVRPDSNSKNSSQKM